MFFPLHNNIQIKGLYLQKMLKVLERKQAKKVKQVSEMLRQNCDTTKCRRLLRHLVFEWNEAKPFLHYTVPTYCQTLKPLKHATGSPPFSSLL